MYVYIYVYRTGAGSATRHNMADNMVSSCFITEQYLYNYSGLGVRVVWKLFNCITQIGALLQ